MYNYNLTGLFNFFIVFENVHFVCAWLYKLKNEGPARLRIA